MATFLLKKDEGAQSKIMPLFSQFAALGNWTAVRRRRFGSRYNRPVSGRVDCNVKNLQWPEENELDQRR